MSINIKRSYHDGFLVSELKLENGRTPNPFKGYSIGFITDFHYGPATPLEHLRRAVKIIGELRPDLLLLGGDLIQRTRHGFDDKLVKLLGVKVAKWARSRREVRELTYDLFEMLCSISVPDGIMAVFGNHDYAEGHQIIGRNLRSKVRWLQNETAPIVRDSAALEIVGIDDIRRGKPDLTKSFSGALTDPTFRIVLAHNPDVVLHKDSALLQKSNLMLSGHTHGGQICLPIVGPVVSRTKQKDHIKGLSTFMNTPIYVSNGIGYGAVSIRLLCPPEVVIIRL